MPILLCILCLLLSGCYTITEYPSPQPPLTVKSSIPEVTVKVNWVQSVDQISQACGANNRLLYGCAYSYPGNRCEIYVIEPRDFNDIALLAMLGHEFWHCLGARHLNRN